jgi:hypothetical protein
MRTLVGVVTLVAVRVAAQDGPLDGGVTEAECTALMVLADGAREDAGVDLLIARVLEGEPTTRRCALGTFGGAARSALVAVLETNGAPRARADAADALARLGKLAAVPALSKALLDSDPTVRHRVAFALTSIALDIEAARTPLIQALGDEEVFAAVSSFADQYGDELERKAPEIPRALQARRAADPTIQLAGGLFAVSLGLALLSFIAFVVGMFRARGGTVTRTENELVPIVKRMGRARGPMEKIAARSRGVSASFSESMDIAEMFEGLRTGERKQVDFALRALGILGFVLSSFLALGFGLVWSGSSAGWGFVGFVVLFLGLFVQQTFVSYGKRRKPG